MKDVYPDLPTIPSEWLVPPELQPEYLDVPGVELADDANLAHGVCDAHVDAGHGDALAVIDHGTGRHRTYAQLRDDSRTLAGGLLARGLAPGERVAIRLPNRYEFLVTALATWRLGAVVVPVPMSSRLEELRHLLGDTLPRVLVADAALLDDIALDDLVTLLDELGVEHRVLLRPPGAVEGMHDWDEVLGDAAPGGLPATAADSVAIVWHTGGTTGRPKGCYHTHRRFLLAGHSIGQATGAGPGQRWAAAAPMGHALGFIYHTIYSLLHRSTVVLVEELHRPEVVLDAIEEHGVTTFTAIAATWARMQQVIEAGGDRNTSSIGQAWAMWQSASSSEVLDFWAERGIELHNNFGSTAFATWVLVPRPGTKAPRASLGRPGPGYEVHARGLDGEQVGAGEHGRMVVRGPSGLTYWNRRELQQRDVADGWTLVDDVIEFGEDGNATYLGRTDFLISTAGHKIAPGEVEGVLAEHSAVEEVGVVGAPDPVRQQVVMAFVVLTPGVEPSEKLRAELQDLVKQRLAPYKYPRRLEFIDGLPRDHVGKVQPGVLKAWADGPAAGAPAPDRCGSTTGA